MHYNDIMKWTKQRSYTHRECQLASDTVHQSSNNTKSRGCQKIYVVFNCFLLLLLHFQVARVAHFDYAIRTTKRPIQSLTIVRCLIHFVCRSALADSECGEKAGSNVVIMIICAAWLNKKLNVLMALRARPRRCLMHSSVVSASDLY